MKLFADQSLVPYEFFAETAKSFASLALDETLGLAPPRVRLVSGKLFCLSAHRVTSALCYVLGCVICGFVAQPLAWTLRSVRPVLDVHLPLFTRAD